MKRILFLTTALLLASPAAAQVRQSGNVTARHAACWTTTGVIQDCGTAAIPFASSLGTVGQGPTICANSAPSTGPYNQLCLAANTNSSAQLVLQNYGGAAAQGLDLVINGSVVSVPSSAAGTFIFGMAPFTIGNLPVFSSTGGTIIDSGIGVAGGSITNATWAANPIGVAVGGTGATTASGARSNLGLGTIATQNAASVALTGGLITGMPSPTSNDQVATKAYVDATSTGLHILAPSRLATATVLPNSPTYANGASGVGATLTAGSNTTLTVDGSVAALNDIVLVKNQAAPAQNGQYYVSTAGSGAAAWVLTRCTLAACGVEFDTAATMLAGSYSLITAGSANTGNSFVLQGTVTTVGTTAATFFQFSSASASQWTTTGSDIYYSAGNVGIKNTVPANVLDICSTGTSADCYISLTSAGGSAFSNGLKLRSSSATSYGFDIINHDTSPARLSFTAHENDATGVEFMTAIRSSGALKLPLLPNCATVSTTADGTLQCAASATSPPVKYRSTNAILYPFFNEENWNTAQTASDLALKSFESTATSLTPAYAGKVLQLSKSSSDIKAQHPTDFAIDVLKNYQIGVWGYGNGNIQIIVQPIDANYGPSTNIQFIFALPATPTGTNAQLAGVIGAPGSGAGSGCAAPPCEWPLGTIGARITAINSDAASNRYLYEVYAIPTNQLPCSTCSKANGGGGTHEGTWDAATSTLYMVSNIYNELSKWDSSLVRQNSVATNNYPHDLVILNNDIWIVNFLGQSLQQYNKTSLALSNTFAITGARAGMGIATDGTNLYLGAGSSVSPSAAIIKFTVATSSQTVLNNTDVYGGGANLPVQYLSGSVWSVHTTNSGIVRINPTTGAVQATLSCGCGQVYGLGNDGTYIYANGEKSVVVVDPAASGGTGAVIATYPFQRVYGGSSNLKYDGSGGMWGTTGTGAFKLDHSNGRLWEIPQGVSGGAKWFSRFSNNTMIQGALISPAINQFR